MEYQQSYDEEKKILMKESNVMDTETRLQEIFKKCNDLSQMFERIEKGEDEMKLSQVKKDITNLYRGIIKEIIDADEKWGRGEAEAMGLIRKMNSVAKIDEKVHEIERKSDNGADKKEVSTELDVPQNAEKHKELMNRLRRIEKGEEVNDQMKEFFVVKNEITNLYRAKIKEIADADEKWGRGKAEAMGLIKDMNSVAKIEEKAHEIELQLYRKKENKKVPLVEKKVQTTRRKALDFSVDDNGDTMERSRTIKTTKRM